jgi:hypothetical protein
MNTAMRSSEAQLPPLGEQPLRRVDQRMGEVVQAGDEDQDPDVKRKEARARTFRAPIDARLQRPIDDDGGERQHGHRDADLERALRRAAARRMRALGHPCALGTRWPADGIEPRRPQP